MIGSKGVAKAFFMPKIRSNFVDCGNSLTTQTLKGVEFDSFRNEAGANAFTLSFIYLILHQKKAVKNV